MTTDPVRLLSQEDDAFTTSLLRSARDGDAETARSRKAAVLGAAGGAAVGAAALLAAKAAPRAFWSAVGAKWLVAGTLAVAGAAGLSAAFLWPTSPSPAPSLAADPDRDPASQARAPGKEGAGKEGAGKEGAGTPEVDPSRAAAAPADPAASPGPADPSAQPADPAAESGASAPAFPGSDSAPDPNADPAGEASPGGATGGAGDAAAARSAALASSNASNPGPPGAGGPASAAVGHTPPASAGAAPADAASSAKGEPALAEEVAALRAAHEALGKGQSQRCLEAVDAYFARFPRGHLSAEARFLRVQALAGAGRRAEAAALAKSMLAASPRSPYAARLRSIAGEDVAPAGQ
ncbi:MAG: hypothetical protein R3F14_23235 [Polyangiaceae bacterium]